MGTDDRCDGYAAYIVGGDVEVFLDSVFLLSVLGSFNDEVLADVEEGPEHGVGFVLVVVRFGGGRGLIGGGGDGERAGEVYGLGEGRRGGESRLRGRPEALPLHVCRLYVFVEAGKIKEVFKTFFSFLNISSDLITVTLADILRKL